MRNVIGIILFFCVSVSFLRAAEQDSLFAAAQNQYTQKNYIKAYHLYEGLIREGYTSPHLFYNFANACLQLEQPEKAIAYYEKALKSQPQDIDIQNNLAFARKQLGVTDTPESIFWARWDEKYLYAVTIVLGWAVLLLIAYILLLAKREQRKKFYWGLLITGACTVYFAIQSSLIFQKNHLKVFAIVQEEVVMYKDPAKLSTEVYDVFAGQKVEILRIGEGWAEVKTERNKRGWVQSGKLIQL